jgi:diketogulonate reductase-like aldo/keto reductase
VRDSGIDREQIFVTTKLPPDRAGRERETIAASLRDLGTDYVDLWLVHWPPRGRARPETWQRFIEARTDGLARAIGVSNYSSAQIDELITTTGVTPAVDQIRWGPTLYDPVRAAELARRGVVLEGYSPFKSSDLHEPLLSAVADRHGVTAAQVILRWHIEHGVAVIPKSANPARIQANIDVFGFRLTDDEIASIDRLGG